jgi:hypothetical protein
VTCVRVLLIAAVAAGAGAAAGVLVAEGDVGGGAEAVAHDQGVGEATGAAGGAGDLAVAGSRSGSYEAQKDGGDEQKLESHFL